MADKFVGERNLKFLLYEVLDVPSLTRFPYYADHSRESFDMALETAVKMGKNLMKPRLSEMDKNAPEYVNGRVKVNPVIKEVMKQCGEGGWIAASFPYDIGGQQLPLMISAASRFIFAAANYSTSTYPNLTTGAAHLILLSGPRRWRRPSSPRCSPGSGRGPWR